MERTMISINVPNTISIVVMGLLGWGAIALGRQAWLYYTGAARTQTSAGY